MTAPKELTVNSWPVNQAALRWLQEAKATINPQQAYVIQLAVLGLESGWADLPEPLAPSQPSPEGVSQMAYALLKSGPWPAMEATQRLFSNPNLSPGEEMTELLSLLRAADDPQEASAAVLQTIYDLMVATSQ
jgi:hypothetical protein